MASERLAGSWRSKFCLRLLERNYATTSRASVRRQQQKQQVKLASSFVAVASCAQIVKNWLTEHFLYFFYFYFFFLFVRVWSKAREKREKAKQRLAARILHEEWRETLTNSLDLTRRNNNSCCCCCLCRSCSTSSSSSSSSSEARSNKATANLLALATPSLSVCCCCCSSRARFQAKRRRHLLSLSHSHTQMPTDERDRQLSLALPPLTHWPDFGGRQSSLRPIRVLNAALATPATLAHRAL